MRRAAFVLVLLATGRGSAIAAPPADSLTGLWAAALHFGPTLRGELRVTRGAAGWRAAIGGRSAECASGDSLRLDFAGGLGRFVGVRNANAIDGFWIQPPGDPIGSEQRYAAPLHLAAAGGDTWRGVVRPLEDTFTLYLRIDRDADGTLSGAFRNPEYNSHGRAQRFHVTRAGDSLWFSARPAPERPEIRLGATFAPGPRARLRMTWPDLGRTIDLVRPDARTAAAFVPRPPRDTVYAYRRPPETGDGWKTARAAEVGFDEAPLAAVVRRILRSDPAATRPFLVHSLLIARHGRLVLEEYFYGYDRDQPHDLRSAGKTYASVLLGVAMREGAPITPESSVYELLRARGPFANPDPRKSKITVAHLLTHTSGLACDDNSGNSPGDEMTMQLQKAQPDWIRYTLDLPVAYEPGTHYAYCSANINLAGAAVAAATRSWLPEMFDRTIARPLQFGRYYFNLIPGTGDGYLGGGTYVRPRDFLKLGQAYLDGGTWNGRRIVDSSWVARSTADQVEISYATTGLDSATFSESYTLGWDALAWHPRTLTSGGHGYREYEANGNGGQMLIVIPELDLTIVYTAGLYGQGGIWQRFRSDWVPNDIIPAIRR